MKIFYELQDVDVWRHPTGLAAFVAVRSVVDPDEAVRLAGCRKQGAGWGTALLETGEHVLLLGIHGEDAEGTLDLSFTTVPNEELLAGLAVALLPQAQPRAMVAFFTAAAAMTSAVAALRAKPGPAAVNQIKQTALFVGPFNVSPETLALFA